MLELEDKVISRWLSGQDIRGICRSLEVPAGTVKGVIREWTAGVYPVDKTEMVAKQLGRLDRMLSVVLPLACSTSGSGVNLKAVTAACKLIMHQNLLLGLCQPNTAQANNNMFVQVNALERQTSTDRIEAALHTLIANRSKLRGDVVQEAQVVESEPADAEPT